MEREDVKSILESLLLVADAPQSVQRFSEVIEGVDKATIAYRQPITRAEIEAIRGVDVDGVIATLLERNLIRAVARKDVPGRPFLYGTTPEFLQLFNLKDLAQLPTLKEMEEITLPEIPGDEVPVEQLEEAEPPH